MAVASPNLSPSFVIAYVAIGAPPIVEGVTDYELSIYDRSGNRVFTTNETTESWNGKINNSDEYATKGIYVYGIILTDINGKKKTYEGTVTLIR